MLPYTSHLEKLFTAPNLPYLMFVSFQITWVKETIICFPQDQTICGRPAGHTAWTPHSRARKSCPSKFITTKENAAEEIETIYQRRCDVCYFIPEYFTWRDTDVPRRRVMQSMFTKFSFSEWTKIMRAHWRHPHFFVRCKRSVTSINCSVVMHTHAAWTVINNTSGIELKLKSRDPFLSSVNSQINLYIFNCNIKFNIFINFI